jgi:hypothetical protein
MYVRVPCSISWPCAWCKSSWPTTQMCMHQICIYETNDVHEGLAHQSKTSNVHEGLPIKLLTWSSDPLMLSLGVSASGRPQESSKQATYTCTYFLLDTSTMAKSTGQGPDAGEDWVEYYPRPRPSLMRLHHVQSWTAAATWERMVRVSFNFLLCCFPWYRTGSLW